MKFDLLLLMRFLGEFTSTALMIAIGCLGCTKGVGGEQGWTSSLLFGLATMIVVHCFGFVSGAHANPCISVACMVLGYITPMIAFVYIIAQSLGAIAGYYLLSFVLPEAEMGSTPGLCMTTPVDSLSSEQAFAIEFTLTSILILGWCALWDARNARYLDSISLRIGLLVTACTLAGSAYTGASMNPARSLAPAVYHNNFDTIGLYMSSTMLAAFIIPFFWTLLFIPRRHVVFAMCDLDNPADTGNM